MSVTLPTPPPVRPSAVASSVFQREALRYAVIMAAVMAGLLALVPVLNTSAKYVFLIVLIPLILWTAFTNTEKALYLYIAWCWMDGTIRGLLDADIIAILARDIVLAIITIGWISQRAQNRVLDPIRWPPASALIGLFIGNCVLQLANPYTPGFLQSLAGLKEILAPIPLVFMAYDVFRRREQCIALMVFLGLATLATGAVFLVQYWHGRDWTWAHFPGSQAVIDQLAHSTQYGVKLTAMAGFRAPGTTMIGGLPGFYCAVITPIVFALCLMTKKSGLPAVVRLLCMGILFIFVVIIFVSSVRTALLVSFGSTVLCTILVGGRLRVRSLAVLAVFGFLTYAALTFTAGVTGGGVTSRFATLFSDPVDALHSDRKTMFDEFGDVVSNAPLGAGLGRTGAIAGHFQTNSMELGFNVFSESYVDAMVFETGLPGAILIIAIAFAYAFIGLKLLVKLRGDDRLVASALLSVLITFIAAFPFINVLAGPPGSVLFWLLFGMLHGIYGPGAMPVRAAATTPAPVPMLT